VLAGSCAASASPAAPRYAGIAASLARGEAPDTTSVLVMRGGAIEYQGYFNGATAETLHNTRSVGKSVTALAVGMAIDRRAIPSVAVPAFGYLPALDPARRKTAITIEDLLTMSSALDCDDNDKSSPGNEANMYPQPVWARWAGGIGIRADYTRDATGRGPWHYCTGGVFLLGQIVQAASRQPVDRFIAEQLFAPLGITRWEFSRSPSGEVMTGGGLLLRTRDLATLGWLVRSEGAWNKRQIVPAPFVRAALTVHRQTPFDEDYGYLFWRHSYRSPCGTLAGWQMSGNGANKVVILRDLDAVIVVTRTHYDGGAASHRQSAQLIENQILPELCRSRSKP
jgi:CubicO group peptidase (beta-lactamase class C family)